MADQDREDLASVLEQALAEAEARADAKGRSREPDTIVDRDRLTPAEAARRSAGGLHQVDESGLPPVRRTPRAARSVGEMLATELPNGRVWAGVWLVLRESMALVGLFWLALIVVSFVAPDGALGQSVLVLAVAIAIILRALVALATSVLARP